jgi:cell division protein FtsL
MDIKQRKRLNMLLLVVLCLYAVFVYASGIIRVVAVNRDTRNIMAEVKMWEEKNRELEYEVQKLNTLEYVEHMARTELGLVKPKEKVYYLYDNQ